jgi:hypothetical protein
MTGSAGGCESERYAPVLNNLVDIDYFKKITIHTAFFGDLILKKFKMHSYNVRNVDIAGLTGRGILDYPP